MCMFRVKEDVDFTIPYRVVKYGENSHAQMPPTSAARLSATVVRAPSNQYVSSDTAVGVVSSSTRIAVPSPQPSPVYVQSPTSPALVIRSPRSRSISRNRSSGARYVEESPNSSTASHRYYRQHGDYPPSPRLRYAQPQPRHYSDDSHYRQRYRHSSTRRSRSRSRSGDRSSRERVHIYERERERNTYDVAPRRSRGSRPATPQSPGFRYVEASPPLRRASVGGTADVWREQGKYITDKAGAGGDMKAEFISEATRGRVRRGSDVDGVAGGASVTIGARTRDRSVSGDKGVAAAGGSGAATSLQKRRSGTKITYTREREFEDI